MKISAPDLAAQDSNSESDHNMSTDIADSVPIHSSYKNSGSEQVKASPRVRKASYTPSFVPPSNPTPPRQPRYEPSFDNSKYRQANTRSRRRVGELDAKGYTNSQHPNMDSSSNRNGNPASMQSGVQSNTAPLSGKIEASGATKSALDKMDESLMSAILDEF